MDSFLKEELWLPAALEMAISFLDDRRDAIVDEGGVRNITEAQLIWDAMVLLDRLRSLIVKVQSE